MFPEAILDRFQKRYVAPKTWFSRWMGLQKSHSHLRWIFYHFGLHFGGHFGAIWGPKLPFDSPSDARGTEKGGPKKRSNFDVKKAAKREREHAWSKGGGPPY